MMNWKAIAVAAALAIPAGAANAVTPIAFVSYGTAVPAGETLVTNFSGAVPTVAAGYALSGTGSFLTGTSSAGAAPAFSSSTADPNQYLSVEGGETETLSTPSITKISLYIGSLDSFNSITFTGPGGVTYTGTQLGLVSGAANGDQTAANTNGMFTFQFSSPINGVTLSSTTNSFEIADVYAGAAGVPEPATWAVMLVGFGSIGAAMRRSRRKQLATA
jgi:hypothetical protein